MSCITELITAGIPKDCDNAYASIGSDKDLILINYDDVDVAATKDAGNREVDDSNNNEGGLTALILKTGKTLETDTFVFEGTDYSVVPSVVTEVKDDGDVWYVHNVLFTAYSKTAESRKVIEDLAGSRVVAVAKERSTGLSEVFGIDVGLKILTVEREYVDSQDSNFYKVTLATPDKGIVRESTIGELALTIAVTP